MVYPISKRTFFPILRLFLKEIKGMENIPKKGPFIITSNHESYLDPFLLGSVIIPRLNKKIHFLAIRGRGIKFFGERLAKEWGGCVVLGKDKEKALNHLLELLKKGKIVGIFTSRRSYDGKLKKGKTGVIRLAFKAHVPILPIGIKGSFDITPTDTSIPRLKRANLNIGKPIYLDKYHKKNITNGLLRKLTDDLMNIISGLTGKPYSY